MTTTRNRPAGDTPPARFARELDFTPGLPDDGERGEPVPVHVEHLAPGVWARCAGVDAQGEPFTVTGAVLRDPMPFGDLVVVAVRDYRARRDVLVFVPAREPYDPDRDAEPSGADLVWLVDDPDDDAGRVEHALSPAFAGCDAARVELWQYTGHGDRRKLYESWTREVFEDVTAADLAELEAHPDVLITRVDWAPLPITAELLEV